MNLNLLERIERNRSLKNRLALYKLEALYPLHAV